MRAGLERSPRRALILVATAVVATGVVFAVALGTSGTSHACDYHGSPTTGLELRPVLAAIAATAIAVLLVARWAGGSWLVSTGLTLMQLTLGAGAGAVAFLVLYQAAPTCPS